jgi:hypothetical protein
LIEDMKWNPRTLEDIGLTFEQFAAAQWEAHRRLGSLASYRRQLTSSSARPAADRAGYRRVDHRERGAAARRICAWCRALRLVLETAVSGPYGRLRSSRHTTRSG